MKEQLALQLPMSDDERGSPDWRLDSATCELGLRGVASVRATLRAAGHPGRARSLADRLPNAA